MFGKKSRALAATSASTSSAEARPAPKVPTIISADMTIRGDLFGAGDLQIEGTVIGRIDVDHLVITANGSVDGEVTAKAVRISGELVGSLSADTVTLATSSKVRADIEYETMVVEAGATLEGQCRRVPIGTRDEKLLSAPTESAVESTLSHLSNVPRRVA